MQEKICHKHEVPEADTKLLAKYIDINSLIVHAKVETIYEDLAGGVEKEFNTSKYRFVKPLPIRPNKELIWLIKGRWVDKVTTYLANYAL